MSHHYEQDMTTGGVPGHLMRFALPLLLGNLLQAAYAMTDMAVVGHFVGETGLAAIANASLFSFILNAAGVGITMGGTVLIAQYKGAGDRQGQRRVIRALLRTTTLAAGLVTLASLAVCQSVFRLLSVPSEALDDACAYTYIISGGTLFIFGYNAACSLLRGLGDAWRPLAFVALAAAFNVGLDLALVGPLGLGTSGAAWATVAAQALALIPAVLHLRRHALFRRETSAPSGADGLPPYGSACTAILRIGIPFTLQMLVINTAYLLIAGLLNRYGVVIAAASGIGLKICTFAVMPCWAVGHALIVVVGQNMGAGNPRRTAEAVRAAAGLNVALTGLTVLLLNLFAERVVGLFSPDAAVIREGVFYVRICCSAGTIVYAVMYTYNSFLTGIGAAGLALFNALLDGSFIRLPLAWLLAEGVGFGFTGIYTAQALSSLIPALVGSVWFYCGPWRTTRLIDAGKADGL